MTNATELRLRIRRRLSPLGLPALIGVFVVSILMLAGLCIGALVLVGWLLQLAVTLLGGQLGLLPATLIATALLYVGYQLGRRSKGI